MSRTARGAGVNVETERPVIFTVSSPSQFGVTVTQVDWGHENWTLVGAPLNRDNNGSPSGSVFKCRYADQECEKLSVSVPPGTENLGLSLSAKKNKAVLCAPRYHYECHTNTFINGFCYVFNGMQSQSQRIPQSLPECPRALLDMAFLIDGSGSVSRNDFWQMKKFIKAILQKFNHISTQFAVVQFSSSVQEEFNFNTYNSVSHKQNLVNGISQMRGGTNTPRGMLFVANEIFVSRAGARQDARRVMITITDGESQQTNFHEAIKAANQKNIIRYAIGVGKSFDSYSARTELNTIASSVKNVFQVDNFQALDNIKNELQKKIFAIEGTEEKGVSSFELEMAQEGFSSLVISDTVVLGAVGTYDWSGGLFLFRTQSKLFINESTDLENMKNSYLGYSVKEASDQLGTYLVVGAPRYQHRGMVLVFDKWESLLLDKVEGTQIGSYFGAEICPVDLDEDGRTDLVLVGAPHHLISDFGGLVLVYNFQEGHLEHKAKLWGTPGEPLSRFGAAIASPGDLNGDGLGDAVVGAPLEEGGQGCVYVFCGTATGIQERPSQRICSSKVEPGLQFFGRAIHGALDLSKDGLTDIVVGALEKVFVFRSRPVVKLETQSTFDPAKIKQKDVDCPENVVSKPTVTAKMCFKLTELTRKIAEVPSFNVLYKIILDPGRNVQRAMFKSPASGTFRLFNGYCLNFDLELETCIQDNYNPIQLEITYQAEGQMSVKFPAPVLRDGNSGTWRAKLPFEQECGLDNRCTDRLEINFSLVGPQIVVVGSHSTLTLDITLTNSGENSFNTVVSFELPLGLTFRKSSIIQSSRRSQLKCGDVPNLTTSNVRIMQCLVNHPIFRTATSIHFNVTMDVDARVTWSDTITLRAHATSDNEDHDSTKSNQSQTVGVKYEVNVIVTGIKSTQYVNFTTGKADTKLANHAYKDRPISCHRLKLPQTLNPSQIRALNLSKSYNVSTTAVFICTIQLLRYKEQPTFNITGKIVWKNPGTVEPQEFELVTHSAVDYNNKKYIHVSQATNRFKKAQVTTMVELVLEVNLLPIIVGSTVGGFLLLLIIAGILFKVGFFKRGFKEKLEEAVDEGEGPAEAT
ncbi:integrin alpha-X-like isoform X3 [Narcine bancroftii]|uniref:integrin alpha-X-like isoform X3 n=1 Tax=Narcine bancroftii TaxID=1343680 RepID=UPI00383129DA